MQSFASLTVATKAATLDEVERGIAHQLLHGGHLGTNLMELGVLQENRLQELLGEQLSLPLGPEGKLPPVKPKLEARLPKSLGRRHRVVPLRATGDRLEVAVSGPVDPLARRQIEDHAGVELRAMVVTPLRLREALHRWVDLPLTERERWLIDALAAGRGRARGQRVTVRQKAAALFPVSAPYRRMSEHPDGITPSSRQPAPSRPTPPFGVQRETRPEGLRDDEPGTLQPGESRPSSLHSSIAPSSTPPARSVSSQAPSSEAQGEGKRITQPYTEGEEEDADGKRDTQPWRDDGAEPDGPVSMPSEFRSSLSDTPPSDAAKMQEEHRRFRHRGPFTRTQAELAVSQAPDVHFILEILLRYARQFFERSVVFVVHDDQAELRLAYGLAMDLSQLTLELAGEGVFAQAWRSGDPVVRALSQEGADAVIRQRLRIDGEQRVTAIPLCIRERVVAIFYGDDGIDGVDRSAVEDVTDFTEICSGEVTRVILRRKREA